MRQLGKSIRNQHFLAKYWTNISYTIYKCISIDTRPVIYIYICKKNIKEIKYIPEDPPNNPVDALLVAVPPPPNKLVL